MSNGKEGEGKGVDEQTVNSLSPHPVVSPPTLSNQKPYHRVGHK